MNAHRFSALAVGMLLSASTGICDGAELKAGVSKVEITDLTAGPANDPLFAKALVMTQDDRTVVLLTVDAVAIGEIGPIGNDFLPKVRAMLKERLGISPENVLVNASHCHGIVRPDSADLAVRAVEQAFANRVSVKTGAGSGHETRIMENRRMRLKDGSQSDVRHAYPTAPDNEIAEVGPVDPEIGILKIERLDGSPLAVVYEFACHPIQGVPGGGNTADYPGFASRAIEETLGDDCLAIFVQGCGGDINPIRYKAVDQSRDAETLGNRLGLSVLKALKTIRTSADPRLDLEHESIDLPKAADFDARIKAMTAEQERLLQSLGGMTLDFESFMSLYIKYATFPEFPSAPAALYKHEKKTGVSDLEKLDERNRADIAAYLANVRTMEKLIRLQTNLNLLKKNQKKNETDEKPTVSAEVAGLRVGDFVLVTFPGELTVEVGLAIKKQAKNPHTFVAGYTNGYLYYTPTEDQRKNTGYAQEDCDCLVAPEWRTIFELKVIEILDKLN
jgi:hypothetical protein